VGFFTTAIQGAWNRIKPHQVMQWTLACMATASVRALTGCGTESKEHNAGRSNQSEEMVLHVYNWNNFIGKTTIADFEAQTGIKVVYDTYDTSETMETKLLTGGSGYDVVFPNSTITGRLAVAGALMQLDKSKLGNLPNLDPELMSQVALNDPANKYAIAYTWGTTGIAYNPALVHKALGTETVDSWSAIFDPQIAAKLAGCGITLLDSGSDVFEAAELYLGTDPVNEDLQELAAAERALKRVRPFVRKFDSGEYPGLLATGETCIALGWSEAKRIARILQDATSEYSSVEYVIPSEGATIGLDTVAIPVDAPHPDNAHAFLDFLMQPKVIAGVTNAVGYANANPASTPFIDAELRNDPSVYPDAAIRARLHPLRMYSQEYQRELGRAWMRVKTGQ
jgi:putrescine transport system substrate-binding protein